jgi:hypothetical protein
MSMNTTDLRQVPKVYGLNVFTVPRDATLESAKVGLPMDKFCREHLTTDNFGTYPYVRVPARAGFIVMDESYSKEGALAKILEFNNTTKLNFRFGTELEALCYVAQKLPHPTDFVSLANQWEGHHLLWRNWDDDGAPNRSEFCLSEELWEECNFYCKVFIVEDLPLSHNP